MLIANFTTKRPTMGTERKVSPSLNSVNCWNVV